jgi:MFS family permease
VSVVRDREQVAILGAAVFTNGLWDMLSVLVPLYGVAVGMNAAEIGLIVAARSVLPATLSIHGGILMDQLGTQRVLLWVAVACAALPLLYPLTGWFTLLFVLQLLLGLASSLSMAASQTWSMHTSRGATRLLARHSVATRVGTFLGPVIVGATWDLFGAWIAFASVAACGAGIIAATLVYAPPAAAHTESQPQPGLEVLLPRWKPHKQAILLAAIPAVAFVLCASFLRNASGGIQSSLYVVYLNGIGMSGTIIGLLVAIAELSGVLGSLLAAPAERRMRSDRLAIVCIVTSVTAIASTPLLGNFLLLLMLACVIRGAAQGMSQPLMYSILSAEVPAHRRGASVGLRDAVVRLQSIITPTVMGVIAEAWGIEASFYCIGAAFLLAAAGLAFARLRSPNR